MKTLRQVKFMLNLRFSDHQRTLIDFNKSNFIDTATVLDESNSFSAKVPPQITNSKHPKQDLEYMAAVEKFLSEYQTQQKVSATYTFF